MSTDLQSVESGITTDQLDLIRRTIAQGASDDELKLFLYDCQRRGVHPLDRLIHFSKRGTKYTPITSIDFMRTRAHATGECAGISDGIFSGDVGSPEFQATVTVKRIVRNMVCEFVATARWSEYFPGDTQGFMWKKMPHTMLGKCAEGLALRKGFPQELAGLYAREEMDQAGIDAIDPLKFSADPPKPRIGARALNKGGSSRETGLEHELRSSLDASEARKAFFAIKAELGFAAEGENWVRSKIEPWLQRDVTNLLAVTADEWTVCSEKLQMEHLAK